MRSGQSSLSYQEPSSRGDTSGPESGGRLLGGVPRVPGLPSQSKEGAPSEDKLALQTLPFESRKKQNKLTLSQGTRYMGPDGMSVCVTGETAGWTLPPDICLSVPGPRMFYLGCIPLMLKRAPVFQSSLLKSTLAEWGQALAFLPFYLGGDGSLIAAEIPNLTRVLGAFENQIKALAWLFPRLHTHIRICEQKC